MPVWKAEVVTAAAGEILWRQGETVGFCFCFWASAWIDLGSRMGEKCMNFGIWGSSPHFHIVIPDGQVVCAQCFLTNWQNLENLDSVIKCVKKRSWRWISCFVGWNPREILQHTSCSKGLFFIPSFKSYELNSRGWNCIVHCSSDCNMKSEESSQRQRVFSAKSSCQSYCVTKNTLIPRKFALDCLARPSGCLLKICNHIQRNQTYFVKVYRPNFLLWKGHKARYFLAMILDFPSLLQMCPLPQRLSVSGKKSVKEKGYVGGVKWRTFASDNNA